MEKSSQSYVRYEQKSLDIEIHNRVGKPSRLQCTPHLHRELEIVWMLEGRAQAYADAVSTSLESGDVYLSFPNQIHHFDSFAPEKYYLLIIKPDMMPDLMELFHTATPSSPVIRGAGNDPRVRELFEALDDICNRSAPADSSYSQTLKRGYLLALLSELLSRMSISKLNMGDSGALRSIVSFCAQNFSEDLSLSMLEERLHLNKYYISHLFSEKLGMRFNDYVNSLRISEACGLLLNSKFSITEISEHVGFNTLRTFNRAFMKLLSVSPSDYRRGAAARTQSPSIPRATAPAAEERFVFSEPIDGGCID